MNDRWPLTGRGEELRVIGEALADDECQGVVVAGQAGVGKTRLTGEAVAVAKAAGWSVRRIAGTATGAGVTLGAFARWVDDVGVAPIALVRQVSAALAADTGDARLLLFVDDAHLIDDLSALVVHQLVLHEMATVIATVRTGQPVPDAVTALWKNAMLRRLELQPLSRNESANLLHAVLDGPISAECADRMWRLSRGNVLFLRSLVEHEQQSGRLARVGGQWRWAGTVSVAPSLVELVEQQIGAVPDDVREVVDVVAIAEPVDRGLLAALADPQAIEAAEQRGLITAALSSDAIQVGHPLYGEIRLSQCGPSRLRRLRARVATAMAQAKWADPLRLGLLWLESDLAPDAQILSRAAEISASRLDLALAERLARAAAAANASSATRLALARILILHNKGEAAQQILDTVASEELVAPGFLDEAILHSANLLWPQANPDEARAVIEEAIAIGDSVRSHSQRTFLAVIQATAAQPDQAIQTMTVVDYDRLDGYGRAVGYSTETIALGDMGRAQQATERASAGYCVLDESPQEDTFQGTGMAEFHAYALLAAGYVDEALAIAQREYQRHAEFPDMSRWMAIGALGMAAMGKGDLTAAVRCLNSASKGLGHQDDLSGLSYRFRILHTEALARAGQLDAAVSAMAATRESRHPAYMYVESGYLLAIAWVSAVQGRTTKARGIIARAAEFARTHGQLAREVLCLQTAVQFGDTGAGGRLDELAGQVEGPRAPLSARYAHALANDAAAGLDDVSRDFEAMGDVLAAADAAAQAAVSHRLAGRRGSALTASARAHLLAKNCGGAVSPALVAATVPLPFTRREHEIAKLLSQGLSNRDIAKATSLSIRTVEGHIYQASAKAGVTSRSQLSDLVQQFQAIEAAD
jgi:DNA-binding CsgD family transcriptional regulator